MESFERDPMKDPSEEVVRTAVSPDESDNHEDHQEKTLNLKQLHTATFPSGPKFKKKPIMEHQMITVEYVKENDFPPRSARKYAPRTVYKTLERHGMGYGEYGGSETPRFVQLIFFCVCFFSV